MSVRGSAVLCRPWWLGYPLVFALFPALGYFMANRFTLRPSVSVMTSIVLINVGVVVCCTAVAWLVTRNSCRSAVFGVVASSWVLQLGSWERAVPVGGTVGAGAALVAVMFGLRWAMDRSSEVERRISLALAVAVVVMSCTGLVSLVRAADAIDKLDRDGGLVLDDQALPSTLPDIYVLLQDAYARHDVLAEVYGFDNSEFLHTLRAAGFHVPERSSSNYAHTFLSVSSMLRMDYLTELAQTPDTLRHDYVQAHEWMTENEVISELRRIGYDFISLSTWEFSDASDRDDTELAPAQSTIELGPMRAEIRSRTEVYLSATALRPLISWTSRTESERLLLQYDLVKEVAGASADRPRLVFMHNLLPHPPYYFDAEGETVADHVGVQPWEDWRPQLLDREGYVGQLQAANTLLFDAISSIQRNNSRPAVIIVLSDHGPAALSNFGTLANEDPVGIWERHATLAAFHFPSADYASIPDTVTPVNIFRLLFNADFGQDFPLLEDRNYWSGEYKYLFEDATEIVRRYGG